MINLVAYPKGASECRDTHLDPEHNILISVCVVGFYFW